MPIANAFTPDGRSVLVVNRDSDNLVIFDADTRTVTVLETDEWLTILNLESTELQTVDLRKLAR